MHLKVHAVEQTLSKALQRVVDEASALAFRRSFLS